MTFEDIKNIQIQDFIIYTTVVNLFFAYYFLFDSVKLFPINLDSYYRNC